MCFPLPIHSIIVVPGVRHSISCDSYPSPRRLEANVLIRHLDTQIIICTCFGASVLRCYFDRSDVFAFDSIAEVKVG